MPRHQLTGCTTGTGSGPRNDTECGLCCEAINPRTSTTTHTANNCNRTFCSPCIQQWVESNRNRKRATACPNCRGVIADAPAGEIRTRPAPREYLRPMGSQMQLPASPVTTRLGDSLHGEFAIQSDPQMSYYRRY